jgi:hypothetical protein
MMAHFIFRDTDFQSKNAMLKASSENIKNRASNEPLKTTRSLSGTADFLTTYSIADIMQGAALYKPEALAVETLNETLSTTYLGLIRSGESEGQSFLNPGREGIAPGLARTASRVGSGGLPQSTTQALSSSVQATFASIHPSDVDSVARVSGDGFAPQEFLQYGNGHIPVSALTPLEGQGSFHRLWAPAAQGFNLMRQAMLASGFTDPIVVSSYRDFAGQVAAKEKYGSKAATPGKSKHGWGIAIDFQRKMYKPGFIVKNSEGQTGLEWLNMNAYRFGFVHPTWARPSGSNPEPWHWEYRAHLQ